MASGSSISTAPLASRASRLWLSSTGTTSRRRSVRRRGTAHTSSTATRPVAAARVWPGTSRAWISAAPAASSSQHRASIVPAVAITSTKRRSPRCQAGRRSLRPGFRAPAATVAPPQLPIISGIGTRYGQAALRDELGRLLPLQPGQGRHSALNVASFRRTACRRRADRAATGL